MPESWDEYGLEFVDVQPFRPSCCVGYDYKVDWPLGWGERLQGYRRIGIGRGKSHVEAGERGEDLYLLVIHDVRRLPRCVIPVRALEVSGW